MSVNKRTQIRLDEGVQVADRRRWQSAMTSLIGDVGSERVKIGDECFKQFKPFASVRRTEENAE